MSEGHRKRHRQQKLLGEFFGGREKRRRIEDPMSSPVAIMQKVVESKERGRRRTSDWSTLDKMVHGGKSGSTRWTELSDQTRPGHKVSLQKRGPDLFLDVGRPLKHKRTDPTIFATIGGKLVPLPVRREQNLKSPMIKDVPRPSKLTNHRANLSRVARLWTRKRKRKPGSWERRAKDSRSSAPVQQRQRLMGFRGRSGTNGWRCRTNG